MADGLERRDFLKILGVSGAGAGLFGCSTEGAEKLVPYVVPDEEIVPGMPTFYRTTCRECPAGCGMEIRTREGRAIKAEGNPFSPISHGKLCARGQASLQGLYNPDRIPQALTRSGDDWQPTGWAQAEQQLAAALSDARGRAVFLTDATTGTLDALIDDWCEAFGVERVRFEPFGHEAIRAANRALFGQDAVPIHDFSNADVVVSFGADFMETWLSPVDYAHGHVQGTSYSNGRRGRLVAVTPHQSLTDMNADDWLAIRPGTEHLVALAMARSIADMNGAAGAAGELLGSIDVDAAAQAAGVPAGRIREVAHAFANNGRSLAVGPGVSSTHRAATQVAAAVGILNSVAGNMGRTVRFGRSEQSAARTSYAELRRVIDRMQAGEIDALLVHGANPLYGVPLPEDAESAIESVPFVASFSSYLDETGEHADLLLPDHHFLESWGDHEPRTGVHSLVQPVMTPVFRTKQTGDVLLSVARRAGLTLPDSASSYYDYLRNRWQNEIRGRVGGTDTGSFDDWWREALQTGTLVEPDTAEPAMSLSAGGLGDLAFDVPEFDGDGEYFLVVYPSYRFYDGRLANRPWLQELPDPVSKISWTSWVEVNPRTAEELGLDTGHVVEVETPYGAEELPVWRHPGIREDTIAVQLGQGHTALGRYATDDDEPRGVSAARLIGSEVERMSGSVVWQQARASLRPTGEWRRLPMTGRNTEGGRDEIALTTTEHEANEAGRLVAMAGAGHGAEQGGAAETANNGAPPAAADATRGQAGASGQDSVAHATRSVGPDGEAGGHGAEHHVHPLEAEVDELRGAGGFDPMEYGAAPQDYPPPGTHYGEYTEAHPRWGMAIDLDRCIGCSACMTACSAENNIGIVGPELVAQGRILTWIRIERYFENEEGDGAEQADDAEYDAPDGATFLPMLCQQCGNAPCEPVCPVYAAYHTPEGLNAQVYNRCVGTRYCANNCPYKVRYFNWYTWEWPEPLNWQLNPEVTVREKGVMEKCTFCVQRIRDRQHRARLDGRPVADGEIVPACAQTCPGNAIVFGDLKDPDSRVRQVASSGRGYRVLEHLNTQSAITYLKRVVDDPASEA